MFGAPCGLSFLCWIWGLDFDDAGSMRERGEEDERLFLQEAMCREGVGIGDWYIDRMGA